MMSASMMVFDPHNTICCQVIKGKCSLSHSYFSKRLCGNSIAAETIKTSYRLFRSDRISWLSFMTGAVLKKSLVCTYFLAFGKPTDSGLPIISSIVRRFPKSLSSNRKNCSVVSAITPSMSTAIRSIMNNE